jgi:hypothetical protein
VTDPFTQEQIEWLAEREAVLDAGREGWVRRQFRRFRNQALVGFLILAGGVGAAFAVSAQDQAARHELAKDQRHAIVQSGHAVSVAGCNRDYLTIGRLRNVLLASQAFQTAALKRGDITQAQFDRARTFYSAQLAGLPLPDCRDALAVLTDNPKARIVIPTPLHLPDPLPPH